MPDSTYPRYLGALDGPITPFPDAMLSVSVWGRNLANDKIIPSPPLRSARRGIPIFRPHPPHGALPPVSLSRSV